MVFKARAENNGEVDPNINTKGRVKPKDRPTNRSNRQRELRSLLNKLKPHVADSIRKASDILKNEEAKHADQLKAAVIILDNYKEMVNDLYDNEDELDNEKPAEQESAPVLSLTVVKT